MVKKYRKKTRSYYKKGDYRTKAFALFLAKKAIRGLNKLKPEWKTNDTGLTQASLTTSGTINLIPGIAQGVLSSQRVGKKCTLVKMNATFHCVMASSATTDTAMIRCIIYRDKQQGVDAKMTPTLLLETVHPMSQLNTFRIKRTGIIYDKLFMIRENRKGLVWRFSKKMNIAQIYNGALGSDIDKNGIFILLIADQGTDLPVFSYNIRFYYTDV